jgi:hypothetical protein
MPRPGNCVPTNQHQDHDPRQPHPMNPIQSHHHDEKPIENSIYRRTKSFGQPTHFPQSMIGYDI